MTRLARALVCVLAAAPVVLHAQAVMPKAPVHPAPAACAAEPGWDDPMPPRHVFGDTWYVGTCGISVLLLASPQGHVLIDGGAREGASRVKANLLSLGVRLKDIRYILVSHEHFDHVGGVADLQRDSGAVVLTRKEAVKALARGKTDRSDPQFEVIEAFPAIANVQAIRPDGVLRFGGREIRNVPMPGHTPGGSGWAWRECRGAVCFDLFYSDSVSALSDKVYRYAAPGALGAPMRQTLARLEKARCDILMTTHPGGSDLIDRLEGRKPLVQPRACRDLARKANEGLDKRLADEAAGNAP